MMPMEAERIVRYAEYMTWFERPPIGVRYQYPVEWAARSMAQDWNLTDREFNQVWREFDEFYRERI